MTTSLFYALLPFCFGRGGGGNHTRKGRFLVFVADHSDSYSDCLFASDPYGKSEVLLGLANTQLGRRGKGLGCRTSSNKGCRTKCLKHYLVVRIRNG